MPAPFAAIDFGTSNSAIALPEGARAVRLVELEPGHRHRRRPLRQAGVPAGEVSALYFTGGSTGLAPLVERIAALFPHVQRVQGDRFASVAQGLGLHARGAFGG